MRPKITSMIKFGYICLALDLVCALGFYLAHDRPRTMMFLTGSIIWIIGILIWYKGFADEGNK